MSSNKTYTTGDIFKLKIKNKKELIIQHKTKKELNTKFKMTTYYKSVIPCVCIQSANTVIEFSK
jgi:hypothetical protein